MAGIEAYRILNSVHSEMPVEVDVYRDNAVVHVFDLVDEGTLKGLEDDLRRIAGVKDFFYKNRSKMDIKLPQARKKEITTNESGNIFLVNLSDYLDTGIFLDHRETRKWIASKSAGKRVLNMFSYTGSFSVYAAKGGADLTHSVDLSRVYCEWAKKNFELNGMSSEKNWILKMDVREYFKYAKKRKLVFDIIILDPPTFSRNKNWSFSVENDHPWLINEALSILAPDGFILFSTNFVNFSMRKDKLNRCRVDQKFDTIPPDFEGTVPHQCFVIRRY